YDAVDMIINEYFNKIEGRKALVLFTDGVDTTSKRGTYESTLRDAEELDALIYPVEYDTYADMGGGWPGGGWPGGSGRGGNNGGGILDVLGAIIFGGNPNGGNYPNNGGRDNPN